MTPRGFSKTYGGPKVSATPPKPAATAIPPRWRPGEGATPMPTDRVILLSERHRPRRRHALRPYRRWRNGSIRKDKGKCCPCDANVLLRAFSASTCCGAQNSPPMLINTSDSGKSSSSIGFGSMRRLVAFWLRQLEAVRACGGKCRQGAIGTFSLPDKPFREVPNTGGPHGKHVTRTFR
jgi:hypothetical protein